MMENKMMLTGAEYILEKISLIGVKHIFGIPGSHIDPLLIASAHTDVQPVINCHELSSGYMSDGYSRSSNKLGVLFGIGGPGSNNMITAVNTARIEKTPLLVITGDVPVNFSDVPGFQCANKLGTNDDAIFKIITKYSRRVENTEELVSSLEDAINIALSPPCGPSHLIIPFNVFNEMTSAQPNSIDYSSLRYWNNDNSEEIIARIKNLILSDKNLVLWIGNSLNNKEQSRQIFDLAEKFHIPVTTSYCAKGVISEDHILALGVFGYGGSSFAKEILLSNDPRVIIGFDIEQNERNTLNWNPNLYKGKEVILINYPGSYSNEKYGESIENNPLYVLKSLHSSLMNELYDNRLRKLWFGELLQNIKFEEKNIPVSHDGKIEPSRLIQILEKEMPGESILFVDSGTHRLFPGSHWKAKSPGSFYSAATVAPLGWAIAAGIGCKFSREEPVVILSGDGCMQMHGIEIKTAVKYNKPVLIVISNNNAFGSIYRRFSRTSNALADLALITEIDWTLFCKSLGAEAFDVTTEESLIKHIHDFLRDQKLTVLNLRTPVNPYIVDLDVTKAAFN
ncbi:MAG: thiamine pyrophosphate-binding protein [Bacteroidales bacterium]